MNCTKNILLTFSISALFLCLCGCCEPVHSSSEYENPTTIIEQYPVVTKDPSLLYFKKPKLPPINVWGEDKLRFVTTFSLDRNGSIEEITYQAEDAEGNLVEYDSWKSQIADAVLDAMKTWKFSPLILEETGPVGVLIDVDVLVHLEDGKPRLLISSQDAYSRAIYDSRVPYTADLPFTL
jgi:hypothetical protein